MTATYKTFVHDRRRGWVAELVLEASSPADLWPLVDEALADIEARGYLPLDPYAAPVAARVAANLAGQARPAAERSTPAGANEGETMRCPLHGVEMTKRESNGRSWYSHRWEGDWCNGKAARGEKRSAPPPDPDLFTPSEPEEVF